MGIDTMGKALVSVLVENLENLQLANRNFVAEAEARQVTVHEALVDTGAAGLSMPKRLIDQLGLYPTRIRRARTSGGPVNVPMYGAVKLTIQGRDCFSDVAELPDDCPVLIGQISPEMLDFVVDPRGQRLIGNPEHGGEQILELYGTPRNVEFPGRPGRTLGALRAYRGWSSALEAPWAPLKAHLFPLPMMPKLRPAQHAGAPS